MNASTNKQQNFMARKHKADAHFEMIETMYRAGQSWPAIAEKLAKDFGLRTTAASLQLFYSRRKARISARLKKEAEELSMRQALARLKQDEDRLMRGQALEDPVAQVAKKQPTQAPALRQAEKAATPQVDPTAIFTSALESIESQNCARSIPSKR